MTSMEIWVIVVFAGLGYWLVSAVLNRKRPHVSDEQVGNDFGRAGAGNNSSQSQSRNETEDRWSHESASGAGDINSEVWYRVLDVPENASKEHIVAAYKKMIGQYHPDKVSRMGEELRALAEFKSKQINVAYDYAMKLRQ